MAKFSFKDATLLYGPLDISGNTNQVSLEASAEEINITNFESDGWKESINGILQGRASYTGFLEDSAEPDSTFFNSATGVPITMTVTNPVVAADLAYAMQVSRTRYSPRMMVGQAYGFDLNVVGSSPLVRGTILATENATAASDERTAYELGAVSASQRIFAGLHVTALTGSPVEFEGIIESDDEEAFGGSPSTRFTFAAVTDATGVSSEWMTPVSGAITDTWWRFAYTITGTGTFTYRVFFGIQ